MALVLSPAKLVLLAVHFAVHADIDSLAVLAARHRAVIRKDLLLRVLLTYLPETLPSSQYVDLVHSIENGAFTEPPSHDIDCSPVEELAEDDAAKKVRKLRLLPLTKPDVPVESADDPLSLFLLRRLYKVDEEAGLLDELPTLLLPFLDHSPCIRALLVSAILPLMRRNSEYYPQEPIPYTLLGFQQLPDRVALNLLLSQTGARDADLPFVARDLRGLVGPWLSDSRRWRQRKGDGAAASGEALRDSGNGGAEPFCPAWDELLVWLTTQASKNWKVAVSAIQQWDGPWDADLNGWGTVELGDGQRDHLERSYAQAALASAYLIPETSLQALDGVYSVIARVAKLRRLDPVSLLASSLAVLPPVTEQIPDNFITPRNSTYVRNHVLAPSNPLTTPSDASVAFLQAVVLSAHVLSRAGCPCTVRAAAELSLLQDEREQKVEAAKLIHAISVNGPKTDDKFWVKARNEILWLRDWGAEDGWSPEAVPRGIFGQVKREFLETEILKALLSNTRYSLARSIYEDTPNPPLGRQLLQDTIYATAMIAYDNASNPNRTRGGLKRCDDIIKSFPKTIQRSDAQARRIEALLQATHALSDYRLVLKQGEPFTPVVLRVHTDPVSIIGKILEQNQRSYTQLHDLLQTGVLMVEAGLTARETSSRESPSHGDRSPSEERIQRAIAERRIIAMCIEAALKEDDFETAYSYVVNRLSTPTITQDSGNDTPNDGAADDDDIDDYSWRAALQAGRYRRTARTLALPPASHMGGSMASANAEVRHLEQRIECLATALRVAPRPRPAPRRSGSGAAASGGAGPGVLQEIVNAFRRAEEELEAALRDEAACEDEWDARGDAIRGHASAGIRSSAKNRTGMPGGFAGATAGVGAAPRPHDPVADEDAAPMSLFDLSRASVLSAQRNLSALSSLQRSASSGLGRVVGGVRGGGGGGGRAGGEASGGDRSSFDMPPLSAAGSTTSAGSADGDEAAGPGGTKRVRKRDQLREAAMGTLVSGVGWLVGAPPPNQTRD